MVLKQAIVKVCFVTWPLRDALIMVWTVKQNDTEEIISWRP